MSWEGLSQALAGIGKFIEKNPDQASYVLGSIGSAISPQGSWQQGLGSAMAGLSGESVQREFLSSMFDEKKDDLISELAKDYSKLSVPQGLKFTR